MKDAPKSPHNFQSIRDGRSLGNTNDDCGIVLSLVSGGLKNAELKNRPHAVAKSDRKIALWVRQQWLSDCSCVSL